MEDKDREEVPAFQLQNTNLNNRCKDVFSCLDAFEKKHQVFERSRALEDADSDRSLIHQGPSQEDMETVNPDFRASTFTGRDYHESKKGGRHGHERTEQHQQFRKPMPPPPQSRGRNPYRGRFGRGRAMPDYKLHPERWTEYSLEDVDISDSSMKRAALDFLHDRRQIREGGLKEESMDLESNACSKGLVTFKRPSKESSNSEQNKDVNSKKISKTTSPCESKTTSSCESKTTSPCERMEADDEDIDNDKDMDEEVLDSTSDVKDTSTPVSKSLKRKLEQIDIQDIQETENICEKSSGFKQRKIKKRNFRSQKDAEDDD